MAGTANLTFAIFEGVLTGTAGGKSWHVFAASGGRGGSKTPKVVDPTVANNPYATGVKLKSGNSGGPIPAGRYVIEKPVANYKGRGRWAKLIPDKCNSMHGRAGFAIHGSGPRGSDGCIVPKNKAEFHELMNALEADNGGTLFVIDTFDGGLG